MNIVAIILAAGRSRRFGEADKRLAVVVGEALLQRVVKRVAASSVSSISVVTAPASQENADVLQVLADLPVIQIPNPKFADGMGTSIAAGIAALDATVEAALIVPADMPEISPVLIDQLIKAYKDSSGDPILTPVDGRARQRNPVLWPRKFFVDLTRLHGAQGGKAVMQAHQDDIQTVSWADEVVFADIDTRDELSAYVSSRPAAKS